MELEKSLSKLKQFDLDDIEYRGIRNVGNLFNLSIDKDYSKPTKTVDGFENKLITECIIANEIKTKKYYLKNILI